MASSAPGGASSTAVGGTGVGVGVSVGIWVAVMVGLGKGVSVASESVDDTIPQAAINQPMQTRKMVYMVERV